MKQAFNPMLPSNEYIPDVEPRVFDGRLYLYGSHDKFNGGGFCLRDYVSYSAPIGDLANFRYEGVIYRRKQSPRGFKGKNHAMYAPDVIKGPDGRYYLYYFIVQDSIIEVAVCDTPAGKYKFLDYVRYSDGTPLGRKGEPLQFDPSIFIDDDGRIYLYTGFAPGMIPKKYLNNHLPAKEAMGMELMEDMITIKASPRYIGVLGEGSENLGDYKTHEFFEASSMRKINSKYIFVYSSRRCHELCYAISDNPLSGFKFKGTIISNGDVGLNGITEKNALNSLGNNHGGIFNINDKYYIFYHRHTNKDCFSRQCLAEEIKIDSDCNIKQVEMTSCGLNNGPLIGKGRYPFYIACNLYSKYGSTYYEPIKGENDNRPFFTQIRVNKRKTEQIIKNFCDGSHCVFKYFKFENVKKIKLTVSGKGGGFINIYSNDILVGTINVGKGRRRRLIEGKLNIENSIGDLKFSYRDGKALNLHSFELI